MELFPSSDAVLLWNGWGPIIRIVIVGTVTYVWILFLLRLTGQRTLATMKAFDFIITIAMGAAFGRILTARQVPIAEAITTFLLLVLLQYSVAWMQARSNGFSKLVTSDPILLYHNGNYLQGMMRKQHIREHELLGVVRKENIASMEEVEAIILEADGTFSVLKRAAVAGRSTYEGLVKRDLE